MDSSTNPKIWRRMQQKRAGTSLRWARLASMSDKFQNLAGFCAGPQHSCFRRHSARTRRNLARPNRALCSTLAHNATPPGSRFPENGKKRVDINCSGPSRTPTNSRNEDGQTRSPPVKSKFGRRDAAALHAMARAGRRHVSPLHGIWGRIHDCPADKFRGEGDALQHKSASGTFGKPDPHKFAPEPTGVWACGNWRKPRQMLRSTACRRDMAVNWEESEHSGHRARSLRRIWGFGTASSSCGAADAGMSVVAPVGHGLGPIVRAGKFVSEARA